MRRRDVIAYLTDGLIKSIPFLTCFGFLFLGLFPFRFSFFIDLFVPFILIALYCWLILRPDLLPPASVFGLGILSDLIYANPLGADTFIFMVFYMVIYTQRRFLIGHSFLFLWGTFAILMVPLLAAQWGLVSLLRWQFMPVALMVGQYCLLIGFYPIIAGLCSKLYNMYLDDMS